VRPVTVLLGSSNVDIGLDPKSGVWPESMRPVYNFGLPGTALGGIYRALRMAAESGQLKYAFISLDFANFIGDDGPGALDEGDREEGTIADGNLSISRLDDLVKSTLSLTAFLDAIKTVWAQRGSAPIDINPMGGTNEGGFIAAARNDGEVRIFAQKHAESLPRLKLLAQIYHRDNDKFANTQTLRAIIAFCDAHRIAATFFIAPSHVDQIAVLDDTGLWPVYEAWEQYLVTTITWERGRTGSAIPLWDFSGYNAYSAESVPRISDRKTGTIWFWDPVHFKRALGEKILSRMLTGKPNDLGVLLTPDSIAAHLKAVRNSRAAYVAGAQ
jgi:hypothetical protein